MNPFKGWSLSDVEQHNNRVRNHAKGVRPVEPERAARQALDRPVSRETESGPCFEICFTIYARRPGDWVNYALGCKQLEDLIVVLGIIPDDDWSTLQGRIISKKVHSEEEERTEITIERIDQ